MYIHANQDLELACDEQVVRALGLEKRKGYAYSLIAAAESGFSPLCLTYTTKYHMEERIRAIMKIKKKSAAAVLAAALLVTGVTAVFATSKAPEPKNIDDRPQAVMTNTDAKPISTPVEKDVLQTAPASDNSAVADPTLTPVDTDTPNTDNRIHLVTDEPAEPAVTVSDPWEPAQTAPENRWNVPDSEIPQFAEFTVADFDDAHELGKYLEATHGLYPGDYVPGCINGTRYIVQITYQEKTIRERLPDGVYPLNSRGETYGTAMDHIVVGYDPDLILVQATNGKSGYAFNHDLSYGGYSGEINNPDDAIDRDHGLAGLSFMPFHGLSHGSDMTQEEELEMIAEQMRKWGNSEEQIAADLEYYKQSRGWD